MKSIAARAFALWLPLVVAITGVFFFASWAVEQNYRQSLNDPQIQMAEDTAALVKGGEPFSALLPSTPPIDIGGSLGTWLALYDARGNPLASSGTLDGVLPRLPSGVFDTSTWNEPVIGHHVNSAPPNENRFSWQPTPDVRQAVVLVHFNAPTGSEYVAAGRNMREVELREATLQAGAAILWGGTALASLAVIFILLIAG